MKIRLLSIFIVLILIFSFSFSIAYADTSSNNGRLIVSLTMEDTDKEYDHNTEFYFKVLIGEDEQSFTLKEGETWISDEYKEGTYYSLIENNIPDDFTFLAIQVNSSYYDHIDYIGEIQNINTTITYINKCISAQNNTSLVQTGDDDIIWMWLCGIAGVALVIMVIFYFKDLS